MRLTIALIVLLLCGCEQKQVDFELTSDSEFGWGGEREMCMVGCNIPDQSLREIYGMICECTDYKVTDTNLNVCRVGVNSNDPLMRHAYEKACTYKAEEHGY